MIYVYAALYDNLKAFCPTFIPVVVYPFSFITSMLQIRRTCCQPLSWPQQKWCLVHLGTWWRCSMQMRFFRRYPGTRWLAVPSSLERMWTLIFISGQYGIKRIFFQSLHLLDSLCGCPFLQPLYPWCDGHICWGFVLHFSARNKREKAAWGSLRCHGPVSSWWL